MVTSVSGPDSAKTTADTLTHSKIEAREVGARQPVEGIRDTPSFTLQSVKSSDQVTRRLRHGARNQLLRGTEWTTAAADNRTGLDAYRDAD
ncbi:hypothetical protein Raf01_41230 [Rugosimonospora africana]|uniref:Uncharacterized protein n=1 Tax=Rugosimonospora africana TaxID=556532 RepID=A0A8J3QWD5_9ACTN|nr:hypothetical protein Raf01_41230 [Rugosimonospora africana]